MHSYSPLMKPLFAQLSGITKSPRLERTGQSWSRVSPLSTAQSSGLTPTLAAGLSISCEAAFGWGSRAGVPRASSAEAAVTMADAGGGDRQSVRVLRRKTAPGELSPALEPRTAMGEAPIPDVQRPPPVVAICTSNPAPTAPRIIRARLSIPVQGSDCETTDTEEPHAAPTGTVCVDEEEPLECQSDDEDPVKLRQRAIARLKDGRGGSSAAGLRRRGGQCAPPRTATDRGGPGGGAGGSLRRVSSGAAKAPTPTL